MKVSKEAKIGLATVIAILLLIWGFNFLKGKNIFKSSNVFHLVYENLGSLKESNAVLVNGFQVGMVTDLNLSKSEDRKVYVRILVDEEYKIPVGSVAYLSTVDIMGTKAIEMKLSDSDNYHVSGDTLKAVTKEGAMQLLEEKVVSITKGVDSLLLKLNAVFDARMQADMKESVHSIKNSSKDIESMLAVDGDLRIMLNNIDRLIVSIENATAKIPETIESTNAILNDVKEADVKAVLENTRETVSNLNNLLVKVNEGEGSVGQLFSNDSLYINIEAVTKELEALLKDLHENPKRYVHFSLFGKKASE